MPMGIIITTDLLLRQGPPGELQLLNNHQIEPLMVLQQRHDLQLIRQPVSPDHLLHLQIALHPPQPVSQGDPHHPIHHNLRDQAVDPGP